MNSASTAMKRLWRSQKSRSSAAENTGEIIETVHFMQGLVDMESLMTVDEAVNDLGISLELRQISLPKMPVCIMELEYEYSQYD